MWGKKKVASTEFDETLDPVQLMPRGKGDERNAQIANKDIPSATWARSEDVARLLKYDADQLPGQMFLGRVGNIPIGTRPRIETYADGTRAAKAEDRHILTVAGSRAGKSMSMIVPNLLDYKGSTLIADPKAELADKTALRRAEDFGQAVFVLDPFEKAGAHVKEAGLLASFNPLSMLADPETMVEDADLIADALVVQGGNDPHWDESAKRLIQGVILHVATFRRYARNRNLCTVRDLLNFGSEVDSAFLTPELIKENSHLLGEDGEFPNGMLGLFFEMLCNKSAYNVVQAAAFDMAEKPDKERDSIISSARRQTAFLDLPRMRAVLQEGTFPRTIPDLSILKTAPGGASIYLCLPAGYLRICSRWLRLFVDLALKAMERTEKALEAPVLFCLDEFPVLGYMPQIEAAAGQLAGFDVRLWPIVQDLTQLKALYADRWETFIGNAAVVQFFGTSDLTTLKYMSELVGKEAKSVTNSSSLSKSDRDSGSSGLSWNVQLFDLLPVHEARVLFDRGKKRPLQLLLYQGLDPIIADRIIYTNDALFQGKERQKMTKPLKNLYHHYMGLYDPNIAEYTGNPYEEVGRLLTVAPGVTETAVMQKVFWDYLDWLLDVGAADLPVIISALDFERGERSIGDALASYLYDGAQYRRENNLPQPPWLID